MTPSLDAALVWFRRDLRAEDQAALHHALRAARHVWCVFVLDRDILDPLPRADRRVEFIVDSLADLHARLAELAAAHGVAGAGLIVRHAWARDEIPALAQRLRVQAVYASHDDEPRALERDAQVRGRLAHLGIALHTSKDHVIFERSEVLTGSGTPYGVFTPYKNAWLKRLTPEHLAPWSIEPHAAHLAALPKDLPGGPPSLADIGFAPTNLSSLRMGQGATGAQAAFS